MTKETKTTTNSSKTKKVDAQRIEITPIAIEETRIRIIGDSPLIVHAWSEKAKKMMLDAQTGAKKGKAKELRDPEEEFVDSMYWLTDKPQEKTMESLLEAAENGAKFGFPVTAIKQAALSATYRKGYIKNKKEMIGAFFIKGNEDDLVEIHSDEPPVMREDMVKIGMGTADLRYRAEFRNWYMDLTISFDVNGLFDLSSIINAINLGGYYCGIGEWRPERDGRNGTFHVKPF